MKLAIPAKCPGLGAQVSPGFGRCEYFVIVGSDKLEFESIKNPNMGAMKTAGVKSSQMLADRKVQVILTGNVGPNAFQALSNAGIQIMTGVTGTVREAIRQFNSGQL
ncbi:NifB/NifX family molybdenum-iron cluster-binding protein [Candidatus Poribacteria bacterium]